VTPEQRWGQGGSGGQRKLIQNKKSLQICFDLFSAAVSTSKVIFKKVIENILNFLDA